LVSLTPYFTITRAFGIGCKGNVGLKSLGAGRIYLRGSSNRNQMITVDADIVCFDEVAEMSAGTVDVMERRLGSSLLGWIRAGSTPRYPQDEAGVLWEQSTQAEYEVRCSHCTTSHALSIMEHLDPHTARVTCRHCHLDMTDDRLAVGRWVDAKPDAFWHGCQFADESAPPVRRLRN